MRKIQFIVSTLILVLLLGSCTPVAAPAPQAPAPAPQAPAPAPAQAKLAATTKPAWQEEWDRTLAAARNEGTVVVLSTLGQKVRQALVDGFKSRFGIGFEDIAGVGAELVARTLAERRAKIYSVDAGIIGFSVPYDGLKPAGALESLDKVLLLPELTDPKEIQGLWRLGQLEWVDKDHTILNFVLYLNYGVTINTNLVKPGEIKAHRDLLDHKWKGKIVMYDPTTGPGGTWFQGIGGQIMDWDYMRKLAEQQPIITRDAYQLVVWLAQGKYAIGLALRDELITEFMAVGAPVRGLMLEEGARMGPGAGAIVLIRDAPHPNAAKLFVNWLLSKEGQTVYSKASGVPSLRSDVSTEGVDPLQIPDLKGRYAKLYTEEALAKRADAVKLAKDIFGR